MQMLWLLKEILTICKDCGLEVPQEHRNTLDELLLICHHKSPHTFLRAVYLNEMTEFMCCKDLSDDTDWYALLFTLPFFKITLGM